MKDMPVGNILKFARYFIELSYLNLRKHHFILQIVSRTKWWSIISNLRAYTQYIA